MTSSRQRARSGSLHEHSGAPESGQSTGGTGSRWTRSWALDFVAVFCIFFIYGAGTVPAINEPHYWTKALHFWNPQFGQGDLFLDSGDAHWLFFATFGVLTKCFSLPIAVWIGRMICWGLLAFGWTQLTRSVFHAPGQLPRPLIGAVWGTAWLIGMHWGHWAGEWVIGGCEAKGLAYGFFFLGLSNACRSRWKWAWLLIGCGGAFHVVTSVWVALSVLCADRIRCASPQFRWRPWIGKHAMGLGICLPLLAVGAIPALLIDWGIPSSVAIESATKQVYLRLGHHLSPTRFSEQRWQGFGVQLAIGFMLLAILNRMPSALKGPNPPSDPLRFENEQTPPGLKLLLRVVLVALAIATIGLAIDVILTPLLPNVAATILRYYWFRWNDVTISMGIGALVVGLAYGLIGDADRRWPRRIAIGSLGLFGTYLLAIRFEANMYESIPAGDKAHLIAKTDTPEDQLKHYRDWVSVCRWIDRNCPLEGLWLTPRKQQSFKWHAKRSELACWKDVPQNAHSLVEWSNRIADAYRFNQDKILLPWTTEQLWELHHKYGIRYVLLDRRVEGQTPPLLSMIYPQGSSTMNAANKGNPGALMEIEWNDTYAIFEFPPEPMNVSR